MFSFCGDTVVDPFCGAGTTMLAAMKANRNSIGVEIVPEYCQLALKRIEREGRSFFDEVEIKFEREEDLLVERINPLETGLNKGAGE